jgi:hypothetical protein
VAGRERLREALQGFQFAPRPTILRRGHALQRRGLRAAGGAEDIYGRSAGIGQTMIGASPFEIEGKLHARTGAS